MRKTYSELISLPTFEERFNYLCERRRIGEYVFGSHRVLNQIFYQRSTIWRNIRRKAILRDNGCDLAIPDRQIFGLMVVHHINPITEEDILNDDPSIFSLENLITVSDLTHKAIHFGSFDILPKNVVGERMPFDTCPWQK